MLVGSAAPVAVIRVRRVSRRRFRACTSAGQLTLRQDYRSATHRSFWQRRSHDCNIWGGKKRAEKLNYTLMNSLKRGLAPETKQSSWNSCRFHQYGEENLCTPDDLSE